jgi:hypothetical protein
MRIKQKTMYVLGVFALAAACPAQEEQKPGLEPTCVMHVKSSVFPSDSLEQYGKARVYVSLATQDGTPIPQQQIMFGANCGVFTCQVRDPGDTTAIDSTLFNCDYTDKNGKVMVYLVNIPFNNQGRVTASCDYGTLSVSASCTFLITRHVVARKPVTKQATQRRKTSRQS